MAEPHDPQFLAGVVEGFYGKPWTREERLELLDWMRQWGLNTYLYAPKDDLKHRALWREPYSEPELAALRDLIAACRERSIRFVFALGPGLDIQYSADTDAVCMIERFEQVHGVGCREFALLLDDIPDQMRPEDAKRFGSFAKGQCHLANSVFSALPDLFGFYFCPTPYCGRMARSGLGGSRYLETIGECLHPKIDVFWTGPEIISREITVEHIREIAALLKRKPVIWDNLHANDYDGRRFFCGPYSGRPGALREDLRGILCNPNCEFPLNYVPLRTFGNYARGDQGSPRQQYLEAMKDWAPRFETVRGPVAFERLVHFCDCFYLPFEDGDEAAALMAELQKALRARSVAHPPLLRELGELRDFCAQIAELRDRPLFYALSRRAWELREELDLLQKYLANPSDHFTSDFHQPGTYRGGFVARLQQMLPQEPDGAFRP